MIGCPKSNAVPLPISSRSAGTHARSPSFGPSGRHRRHGSPHSDCHSAAADRLTPARSSRKLRDSLSRVATGVTIFVRRDPMLQASGRRASSSASHCRPPRRQALVVGGIQPAVCLPAMQRRLRRSRACARVPDFAPASFPRKTSRI